MIVIWKTVTTRLAIAVLVLFPLIQTTTLAADVTYTVVEENIYDKPIKTQIEQHIVVSGVPTRAQLEAEILERYRAAAARRGFLYYNPATNIYIYVYGTEQQARAGEGLWIGMIAKGFSDKEEPQVRISENRLAALSLAPEERFGLSEQRRRQIFREIVAAGDRATLDAMAQIPDSQIMKQLDLERELEESYKAKVAQQHSLTNDQLLKIAVEGGTKGWPTR